MSQLGNIGYAIYVVDKENLLIMGSRGSHLVSSENTLDHLLSEAVEDIEEDDVFLDYKINMAWGE